jgi:hypothetical protein
MVFQTMNGSTSRRALHRDAGRDGVRPGPIEPPLSPDLPIVHTDADVKVRENHRAPARAWVVQRAAQMGIPQRSRG